MANGFLGEILGRVLGNARDGGQPSPVDNGSGGLGDLLGGVLGRGSAGYGAPVGRGSSFGGRGALMAMLLPIAMQWVQRNGGIGAVLQRFRQKGYGPQANSWMSTGPNEALAPQAVDEVVGTDELSRLSQQLGVGREDVASGFAEILPEMVDRLTPEGNLPPDADEVLDNGRMTLEQFLNQARVN